MHFGLAISSTGGDNIPRQMLLRTDDGQLVEPTGQQQFDFTDASIEPVTATSPGAVSAERLWERACAHEEKGELQEAAKAYREILFTRGPDANTCFNLGNVLYDLGDLGAAAERFRQAVELDHEFADAWNNLGNALMEQSHTEEAIAAYRQALAIRPDYADAHYSLADVLEMTVGHREARRHWKEFLRLEPAGEWASYVRQRLTSWQRA